jgi:SagB-type dehydrogenase family enzyme
MKFIFLLRSLLLLLTASSCLVLAAEPATITLPQPRLDLPQPLMQALQERQSRREFEPRPLPLQTLANLLWAAYGINRPQEGKRTAPSAHNRQEVDVYVVLANGAYRYDAAAHALRGVTARDIRAFTGRQKFPAHAPLNLVYVADLARMKGVPRADAIEVAAVSTGAIVQNVYLYCAAQGLAVVVRGWVDKAALAKALGLRQDQYIIVAQTVGYPAK